jgi:EAL domain-containing protein (putative c-di-GMP-specific phosphodiesterase class I)
MTRDGHGNEIVKAIFKLGQALSKDVYAEGIETGTQLLLLQELGCEYGQGYLLSRPLDAGTVAPAMAGRLAAAAPADPATVH